MKIGYLPAVFAFLSFIPGDNDPANDFRKLKQLTGGTWIMQGKTRQVCEQWKQKDAHTLAGRGFYVQANDTSWQESVELVLQNNILSYISTVIDQNEGKSVLFRYAGSENGAITFSNPQHDFPQNITYQFIGKDSLHAWISGRQNGKAREAHFYYKRQEQR
jgi:hypothetical protein